MNVKKRRSFRQAWNNYCRGYRAFYPYLLIFYFIIFVANLFLISQRTTPDNPYSFGSYGILALLVLPFVIIHYLRR